MSSFVTMMTTVSRGFRSATDCGMVMFLVFGRISTSELCNNRNTTSMVSMSMNGTSAMWLPWCAALAMLLDAIRCHFPPRAAGAGAAAAAPTTGASPTEMSGNSSTLVNSWRVVLLEQAHVVHGLHQHVVRNVLLEQHAGRR